MLAWSGYSVHAFGHVLPNTNAAKRAGPHESVLLRLITVYAAGLPIILAGTIAGLVRFALHPSLPAGSLRTAFRSSVTVPLRESKAANPELARTLPLDAWLFILWAAIYTCFYVANHTYVQTRYVFISAPGLSIIVLGLALSLWPRFSRWVYLAALAAGVAISVVIVVPFLRNKSQNCDAVRQMARFIHDRLPPDAPVAAYGIGQIAFESEHPIVDTGGITQPGAIPYLYGPPEAMARWAESEGARYYISGEGPTAGSAAIFTIRLPFIGWTFYTSQYSQTIPVSIWRMPTAAPTLETDLPKNMPPDQR